MPNNVNLEYGSKVFSFGNMQNIFNKAKINKEIKNELENQRLVGFDIFINYETNLAENIIDTMVSLLGNLKFLKLESIGANGVNIWPRNKNFIKYANIWHVRFKANSKAEEFKKENLLKELECIIIFARENNIDFTKIQNLYEIDGMDGYWNN